MATINVNAGGNLQAALDAALPGDVIVLEAGATFVGNFTLKPRSNNVYTDYITVTTSTPASQLPGPTTRITPASSSLLPKLQSPSNARVIIGDLYSHHWKFQFIECIQNGANGQGTHITLGYSGLPQTEEAMVPHHFIFDRCYLHGSPTLGQQKGMSINASDVQILNCWFSDYKWVGDEAWCIGGWNGNGNYLIHNCYLEAAGENIMFGGGDPKIPGMNPDGITFTSCYFNKPDEWRTQSWTVKNIFELKVGTNVLVEHCYLRHNWVAAQAGYAILLKSVNQEGGHNAAEVGNVIFRNNIVSHVSSAINLYKGQNISGGTFVPMHDVEFTNNLFLNVSSRDFGGAGRVMMIGEVSNVKFTHNTCLNDGNEFLYAASGPNPGFEWTDNINFNNSLGIKGTGTAQGWIAPVGQTPTGDTHFPGGTFLRNIIAKSPTAPNSYWPTGNFYPGAESNIGFTSHVAGTLMGGDYRLASTSPYKGQGLGGTDPGVTDWAAIDLALAAVTGGNAPVPTPTPQIVAPANQATGVSTAGINLQWVATGAVNFDVYFGTASNPPLVSSAQVATSRATGALTGNTTYYWRIVARDSLGGTQSGATWSFTTGPAPAPPPPPQLTSPEMNSQNVSVTPNLLWSGVDTTNYDVYFGTTTNPPMVSSAQAGTTYLPGTLLNDTIYYWRVVARNANGTTSGALWAFKTIAVPTPPPDPEPDPDPGPIEVSSRLTRMGVTGPIARTVYNPRIRQIVGGQVRFFVILEANLNGVWTEIQDDLRDANNPISGERGMRDGGPLARVAATGMCSFKLNNYSDAENIDATIGYYTPGHPNCRAGWRLGIDVRIRLAYEELEEYMFYGTVESCDPAPGKNGDRTVTVQIVDWMEEAATNPLEGLQTQTNIRSDQLFLLVTNAARRKPPSVEAGIGMDFYEYALDTARSESMTIMTEYTRIGLSEIGQIYIKKHGGVVFESRRKRGAESSRNLFTFEHIYDLRTPRQRASVINLVRTVDHPRRTDDTPVVLWQSVQVVELGPNEEYKPFGGYSDPQHRASRVGAASVIPLEPGVDYAANEEADGTGDDRTSVLEVTANTTGNGVSWVVKNTSSDRIWLRKLQIRGFGLYDYERNIFEASDLPSQAFYGVRSQNFDMPYQSNSGITQGAAYYILGLHKDPYSGAQSFSYIANRDDAHMRQALLREISDRIGVVDPTTGLVSAQSYFINGMKWTITEGVLRMTYILAPADANQYWQLSVPGRSELGVTTRLGFGLFQGHIDVPHEDVHSDVPHEDDAHVDIAHVDVLHDDDAHADHGHSDAPHADVPHSDRAFVNSHSDTPHWDVAHADAHSDTASHSDVHSDTPFTDQHNDVAAGHYDALHGDYHGDDYSDVDIPPIHTDYHGDSPHYDSMVEHGDGYTYQPHSDVHSDSQHSDIHSDVPHGDSAHSDLHGDVSHQDTLHEDTHGDAPHGDGPHGDSPHVDTAHDDQLHDDVAHDDVHTDLSHGDDFG